MNNIKIDFCLNEILLNKVKALSDLNKKTLGFLPYSVIESASKQKQIICAYNDENILYGYLLFNISKNRVKIVHFCIDNNYRNKGISKKILSFLENHTHNGVLNGISLSCRRDYGIQDFWNKLGFCAIRERKGRGIKPSILTEWFKSYSQGNLLFDILKPDTNKISAVLDSCILIDLYGEDEKVSSLLSDWLGDSLEYIVTQEAYNDIDRCENEYLRVSTKKYIDRYKRIDSLNVITKNYYIKQLELLFLAENEELNENTKSDITHIAISAEHNVSFFVTNDRMLLGKKEEIYEILNIKIVTPFELIDEIYNNKIDYNPKKMHSLDLRKRLVPLNEVKSIFQEFLSKNEKLLVACNQISTLSKSPENVERILISSKDENQLFAVKIFFKNSIALKFLRTNKHSSIADSLLYEFMSDLISSINNFEIHSIIIEDKICVLRYFDLLSKMGFILDSNGCMKKYAVKKVLALEECISLLKNKNIDSAFIKIIERTRNKKTVDTDDYLERIFYPLIINDSKISYYTIPIKYNWAMELFQKNYAKNDCIGVQNSNLIISRENVYYSASPIKNIDLPARILWYTSRQKGEFSSMEISAISKIDSYERGNVKYLFKKNEKYGVFKWKDVKKLSSDDKREIIAIKFFDTFLLQKTIKLEELLKIGISAPQSITKINPAQKRELLALINE